MSSLASLKNVIPLLLQIFAMILIQVASLYYLYRQKWFVPIKPVNADPIILSWENTVLFLVSCYQYVILATVYSKGRPYREMLITNFWFLLSAVGLTLFTTWLLTYPCKPVADVMEIIMVSPEDREMFDFRFILLAFPISHLLLALFIEVSTFFKR